ncbi:dihydroorotate dehydrogenase [Falsigemmobacter faecalis]|uniref:Dihydroorotate dehydrogenase n=1 Tax=Falsigemmobacter faecalis TaxID=2488730 RepID=A0A3P3DRS9_9RHOB|nr:dihydroorotate dehydrogenase [Falsigemmobacter faecalis]RRH76947.1 dihydroorotate dehydrogenase [Falsigemmobacter faecalis]
MKMTADKSLRDHDDDAFLDAFFAAARAEPQPVPEALSDRVLQLAAEMQPAVAALPPRTPARRGTIAGVLRGLFGGSLYAGQLAGIALAAVAGVWMGLVQPVSLGVAGNIDAELIETIELLPDGLDIWAQELGMDLGTDESND